MMKYILVERTKHSIDRGAIIWSYLSAATDCECILCLCLNWEKLLEESKDNEEIVEKWRKIVDNSINEIKNDKSSMLQEIIVEFTKQFKVYFNGFMKKPQDEPIDDAIDVLMNRE